MLKRYSLPEMEKIWSDENRFQLMLDVEVVAAEAMADLDLIPKQAFIDIKEKASFSMEKIRKIENTANHDLIPFLTIVGEYIGDSARYLHLGLTSSDVLDTSLSLQMLQASELLLSYLNKLRSMLADMARKYKYTMMIGRTHGLHAEPMSFGLKMAAWTMEIDRSIKRLQNAREVINVGKLSGAVGTFAHIDPHVEVYVCRKLGLHPAFVTSQILQRDRHAQFITAMAIIGSSIDKFATEIRNLQRTEILEVEERVPDGQLMSSTLIHKRNPVFCERISGLARVLRGYANSAMENISLWHERDLAHSTTERIIIPDSCTALHYMLHTFHNVLESLVINEHHMRRNLNLTLGLVCSQRVLLALLNHGVDRETASELVQRNAEAALEEQIDFQFLILQDPAITSILDNEEINELFDNEYHLRHIDYIYQRAEL